MAIYQYSDCDRSCPFKDFSVPQKIFSLLITTTDYLFMNTAMANLLFIIVATKKCFVHGCCQIFCL